MKQLYTALLIFGGAALGILAISSVTSLALRRPARVFDVRIAAAFSADYSADSAKTFAPLKPEIIDIVRQDSGGIQPQRPANSGASLTGPTATADLLADQTVTSTPAPVVPTPTPSFPAPATASPQPRPAPTTSAATPAPRPTERAFPDPTTKPVVSLPTVSLPVPLPTVRLPLAIPPVTLPLPLPTVTLPNSVLP